MEWLQTYKIGKALLNSGFKPIDAYFQSYIPQRRKVEPFDTKKAHVITINISTKTNSIQIIFSEFDDRNANIDGFFSSITGNFTSYYLCTPYKNKTSILDFLGVDECGVLAISNKTKELLGYEKEYEELIKKGLLNDRFRYTKLISIRNEIRNNSNILKKIGWIVTNLNLIVEKGKEKDKKYEDIKNTFSEEEITSFREYPKLFIGDKGEDDISYIRFSVNNLILNQLPEYHEFCFKRFVSFGKIDSKTETDANCYLNSAVKKSYAVEFPRDNVNILKTSTSSFTSAPYFQGNSFLLGRDSYDAIKLGAKYIDKYLKLRISNILHYVVPEFIDDIDINKLKTNISEKVELAFSTSDFRKTNRDLRRLSGYNINSIILVGCIKGKGDIDFVNSIKISNIKYFDSIFDEFDNAKCFTDTFLVYSFSFKSIYNLFPVSTDKNKKPDSLFFIKAILERSLIEKSFLMDGYIRLINIYKFRKPVKEEDRLYPGTINIAYKASISFDSRIEIATKKYLVLLNLISKVYNMENQNIELVIEKKSKTQIFFNECNYLGNNAKIALFYLGKLIRKVALAQSKKQKSGRKPILDKINYSGMSTQEIQWLFCEVVEKLKQYEQLDYFAELDMESFSNFFAKADKDSNSWQLTNQENTFFLFTGYSMFFDVIEEKQKVDLKKAGYSDEHSTDESEQSETDDDTNHNSEIN